MVIIFAFFYSFSLPEGVQQAERLCRASRSEVLEGGPSITRRGEAESVLRLDRSEWAVPEAAMRCQREAPQAELGLGFSAPSVSIQP